VPLKTLLSRLVPHWRPRIVFHVIRMQLSRTVPFARGLGLAVDRIDERGASTRLPESPQLHNHVGTLHAGALFTACEAASGAALAGALLPLIMQARFVVRDARISYLKPARGELLSHAALVDDPAEVLDRLRRLGRTDVVVDVSARTAAGTPDEVLVAKASFDWHLKLIDAAAAAATSSPARR
jgi:thioesterase domain-containing protein